ncbi:MAG: TolC family protein [Williamsia sp.]|nr:TolC family protein [Williamsia sp.]
MRLLCLLFFSLFLQTGFSQEVLSIDDAVSQALKYNYDIEIARTDSSAYAIDNEYAYAGFLPTMDGSFTRLWNTNNQRQLLADGTKRGGNGIRSKNFALNVSLNWTLFDGLRMFATKEKLAEFVRLGEYTVKEQVVNSVAAVINNYYNIVRQKQQLKAIEEQISINDERVQLANKKFSVGLGAKPELLQAKVDYNAQKAAQYTQQTLIAQLREQLNQLIGFPTAKYYEVSDSIPINTALQYGNIRSDLEKFNPTLQIARKNIDISKLTVRETWANLFPTAAFTTAYNFTRVDNTQVLNPFSLLVNQNRGFNYGVVINVPIFSGFETRRQIRQAKLDVHLQEINLSNQFSLLDVTVNNAFKNYELYKKLLNLEEDNILLAKENVNIALQRFKLGASTYIELHEAQISLGEAYDRLIAARYNTKVAETELLRLQGKIVK